jgi:DNA-binding MarR family transcriptional regulator
LTPSDVLDAIEALGRAVHAAGFSHALNPAQWAALRFVARSGDLPRTVAGFARHHRATTGTASQTIDALVRKRLVLRVDNPQDRRSALLTLTEAARAILAQDPLLALEQYVAGLPAREITALHGHLTAFAALVHRR